MRSMTALQIFLIVTGIAVIAVSYFISDRVAEEQLKKKAEEIVLGSDSKEILLRQTKETVEEILENLSGDVTVRAERELDKISNEKIMAVHEYSETVLNEINKNHNEVMFLYSMLDDKDKEIKQTVKAVRDTLKSVQRVEKIIEEKQFAGIEQNADDSALEQSTVCQEEQDTADKAAAQNKPEVAPEAAPESVTAPNSQNSSKEEIIRLHNEGMSNVEIAKSLSLGVGEVKLVLGLLQGAEK